MGIRKKTNGSVLKEYWVKGKEFGDKQSYIKKRNSCQCTIF